MSPRTVLLASRRAVLIFAAALALSSAASAQPVSYLRAPAVSAYDLTDSGFTVEFWVRVQTRPLDTAILVQCRVFHPGTQDRGWNFVVCNASCAQGRVLFQVGAPGTGSNITSTIRIDDGNYHHVAATYDGRLLQLFVDGIIDGADFNPNLRTNLFTGELDIGMAQEGGVPLDGQIDDLRLWKLGRLQADIQTDMLCEALPDPSLVGYWPLDGDGADRALGNDLQTIGSVLICDCGGVFGGAADILPRDACPQPACACSRGNVNAGCGAVADVLFVNGSAGDSERTITVSIGDPVAIRLDAASIGPASPRYVLWVWSGLQTGAIPLVVGNVRLGCTVASTPFQPFRFPQPFRCLRGGLNSLVCTDVPEIRSPARAPWTLTHRGFPAPIAVTIQAVVQDDGAGNPLGFSVTNAIVVDVH